MSEGRFSMESVLKLREAEQEKIEKELARIGQERARERELGRSIRQEMDEIMASFAADGIDRGAGSRIAFYAWLGSVGEQIQNLDRRLLVLDAEYKKVHMAWRRARMEKEKIQTLRERFLGDQRIRERRVEERSLDAWVLARRVERPGGGGQ